MADVRVICAIGKRGQLGLNGQLPWEGNPGAEYRADVERLCANAASMGSNQRQLVGTSKYRED